MEYLGKTAHYYSKLLKTGQCDADFFEFIRRVEQLMGGDCVGSSVQRQKEPVRFGQLPTLQYPKNTIAEISEKEHLMVFVNFMGLNGCNGPMPLEITDYIYRRAHNSYDFTLRRFNDIINHRFIGLFYRAWKSNELAGSLDSSDGGLIVRILTALSGHISGMQQLPDLLEAGFCGQFGCGFKSASGLELMLKLYFGATVRIVEKVERTVAIPDNCHCHLGNRSVSVLGENIQLGSRFMTRTSHFRIEVGPISFDEADRHFHLPESQAVLRQIINRYIDRPMTYELKISLRSETIPPARLTGKQQLGRSVWLPGQWPDGLATQVTRYGQTK